MRSALCAGSCTSGYFRPYSPECVEEEFSEVRPVPSYLYISQFPYDSRQVGVEWGRGPAGPRPLCR